MDATTHDDRDKLRRYVARQARATGRDERAILREIRAVADLAPAAAGGAGWRRVRAAVDAEDNRHPMGGDPPAGCRWPTP